MTQTVRTLIQLSIILFFTAFSISGNAVSLDNVSFSALAGERVQVRLDLSESLPDLPVDFKIDDPARIALDFPGVDLNLDKSSYAIGVGVAQSVHAVQAQGRARVVINLARLVPYEVSAEENSVLITLTTNVASNSTATDAIAHIEDIDFRRGKTGEGRVIVRLSDPSTTVNFNQEGGKIILDFVDVQLPEVLDRTLDVTDFATPVQGIDTAAAGNDVRMVITMATEQYEHLAYQMKDSYTIEFRQLTEQEQEQLKKDEFGYTGERLSLNFQDIEVRAVLQLLAEFNGFNLVANDNVTGNITMRLNNVPWDQALDIVLRSHSLGLRQSGNVWMIAPQEEIAAREKLELEASRQIKELAPLRTELMQVNYADAEDLAVLIKEGENSLLSDRGNISIDARTNILIVQDVAPSLADIRRLVKDLDIPVRQVLIESRIVNASENFAKNIGVRFGYSTQTVLGYGGSRIIAGGGRAGDVTYNVGDEPVITGFSSDDSAENLMVDLPATGTVPAAAASLAIGKIGSYLLRLELSAMIAEGRGESIASPRVITSNQTEAVIEEGVQIPYQEATSSGATAIAFKDATLSLRVTPQITPDDRILMNLDVTQNARGSREVQGVPTIDTRSVSTQVLVNDGETVVLGGVYQQEDNDTLNRVPFFGDIPYLGFLFKRTGKSREKRELLIFVTPKVLKEGQIKI